MVASYEEVGPPLPDLDGDLLLRLFRRARRLLKTAEDGSDLPGIARSLHLALLADYELRLGGMSLLHFDYLRHNRIAMGEFVAAYQALGMPERAGVLREVGELIARTPPEKVRALLEGPFVGDDGLLHWAIDGRRWSELSPSPRGHLALWLEGQRDNRDVRAVVAAARKRKRWREHVARKRSLARFAVDQRCPPLLVRALARGVDPDEVQDLFVRAVKESSPQVAEVLLQAGADPNGVMETGHPLVLKAALRAPVCRVLLDAGADVHARSSEGATILFYVRDTSLAERAIRLGVDPHVWPENRESLLHRAALCGELTLVNLYVRAGLDPLSLDYCGRTPLAVAMERREWSLAECLAAGLRVVTDMDAAAGLRAFTALHEAAAFDRVQDVVELLAQGASRRVRSRDDVALWVTSTENPVGIRVEVPASSTPRDVAIQLGAQRAAALL